MTKRMDNELIKELDQFVKSTKGQIFSINEHSDFNMPENTLYIENNITGEYKKITISLVDYNQRPKTEVKEFLKNQIKNINM